MKLIKISDCCSVWLWSPRDTFINLPIIDHQQSWEYEEGSWKGPALLVVADLNSAGGSLIFI